MASLRKIAGVINDTSGVAWGNVYGSVKDQSDLVSYVSDANNEVIKKIDAEAEKRRLAILEEDNKLTSLDTKLKDEIDNRTHEASLIKVEVLEIKQVLPTEGEHYATKEWVDDQGYIKEHQSLDDYARKSWVEDKGYITSNYHDESKQDLLTQEDKQSIADLKDTSDKQDKITEDNKLPYNLLSGTPSIPVIPENVSAFNNDAGYLTSHQDISYLASRNELEEGLREVENKIPSTDNLATKDELSIEIAETKRLIPSVDNLATKNELEVVDAKVPTKTSQLTNDSNFLTSHQSLDAYAKKTEIPDVSKYVTASVSNLVNYYLKSETYTQDQVDNLIAGISSIRFEVVSTLPSVGEPNVIYLVPDTTTLDVFKQYVYVAGGWKEIGRTDIDLTDYATKAWVSDQNFLTEHQSLSGYVKVSLYNQHISNTSIHTSSAEKSVWNTHVGRKDIHLVDGEKELYTKHVSNESIHVSSTEKNIWNNKSDFSGNYSDLVGRPIIPGRLSQLINDVNYTTVDRVDEVASDLQSNIDAVEAKIPSLEGYATETWVEGRGYLTEHQDISSLATKSEVSAVGAQIPTKVSQLTNDSGYLTEHQSLAAYATNARVDELEEKINLGEWKIINSGESLDFIKVFEEE